MCQQQRQPLPLSLFPATWPPYLAGAGINLARPVQAYHSGGLYRFAPLLAPTLPYFADPAATDFSYLRNLAGFLLVLT